MLDELGTTELLLAATLDELCRADELDGTAELLLGAALEELGGADELDGTTELLLGAMLEELDEVAGEGQLLLGEPFIISTHSFKGNGPSRQAPFFMQ
jgi:hypothetical protein